MQLHVWLRWQGSLAHRWDSNAFKQIRSGECRGHVWSSLMRTPADGTCFAMTAKMRPGGPSGRAYAREDTCSWSVIRVEGLCLLGAPVQVLHVVPWTYRFENISRGAAWPE